MEKRKATTRIRALGDLSGLNFHSSGPGFYYRLVARQICPPLHSWWQVLQDLWTSDAHCPKPLTMISTLKLRIASIYFLWILVFYFPTSLLAQTFEFAKRLGCDKAADRGASIVVDKSGNIYSTGYFRSFNGIGAQAADLDPGPAFFPMWSYEGGTGVYISKLNFAGNFVWAKQFQGVGGSWGTSILMDQNEDIYITGRFSGTLDFDPGPNVFSITSNPSNLDIFLVKLDSDGNFIWAKSFSGNQEKHANGLIKDRSGNILISGFFSGKIDLDPGPDSLYTEALSAQFQALNSNGL